MVSWPAADPTMARLTGNSLLAIGVSSWLGYRAANWQQVRITLIMEIALTVLGALITLYSVLFGGAPSFAWGNFAVFVIFGILWIYFYATAPNA